MGEAEEEEAEVVARAESSCRSAEPKQTWNEWASAKSTISGVLSLLELQTLTFLADLVRSNV